MKKIYCDQCDREIPKEEKIWRIIIAPMIYRGRGPVPTLFPSQESEICDPCHEELLVTKWGKLFEYTEAAYPPFPPQQGFTAL